jgi:hypothetical protein
MLASELAENRPGNALPPWLSIESATYDSQVVSSFAGSSLRPSVLMSCLRYPTPIQVPELQDFRMNDKI